MIRKVLLTTTAVVLASSVALANSAKGAPHEKGREKAHGAAEGKAGHGQDSKGTDNVGEAQRFAGKVSASQHETLKQLSNKLVEVANTTYGQESISLRNLIAEANKLENLLERSTADIQSQLEDLAARFAKATGKDVDGKKMLEDILNCKA